MSISASDLKDILKHQQDQFESLLKSLSVSPASSLPAQARLPKFENYDKSKEKIQQYLERIEQHFLLHNVKDKDVQRACLLSSVGSETYQLIKNVYAGEDLTSKTYEEITKKLMSHFEESTNKYAARYVFSQAEMKPGQSYADWVADLRGLAVDCDFNCHSSSCGSSYTDQMIIDVVIRKTPHPEVRRQLLQDKTLTVELMINKAQSYVQTCKSEQIVQGAESPREDTSVNRMTAAYKPPKSFTGNQNQRSGNYQMHRLKGCPGCYVKHGKESCPARDQICRKCGGKHHFASVCMSKNYKRIANQVEDCEATDNRIEFVSSVVPSIKSVCRKDNQIYIPLSINDREVHFQWDSGATCSMVGLRGYAEIGFPRMLPCSTSLKTYSGHTLPVKGQCHVDVIVGSKCVQNLPLLVVDQEECGNLLGLTWADKFGLTEFGLSALSHACTPTVTGNSFSQPRDPQGSTDKLKQVKESYPSVFEGGLGRCSKTKAHIQLKDDASPVFAKARSIPFSQRQPLKEEIERLEKQGVLEKVSYSEWASPVVIVSKGEGKVRVCGDFVQVNQRCETQQHPLPQIDDLFSKLQGGKFFTKLDLSDAYFQIELDDDSKKICVINTPFGIYRYNCLPFGIASAPAIFMSVMDQMMSSLNGVAAFLDDIIITGRTEKEHWKNFEAVIAALSDYGFQIREEKCVWMQRKCEYLGFEVSADGRSPSREATKAVQELPRPKSIEEVKAFLGKIGYYAMFVPQMASKAAPLHAMLQKDAKFVWTDACESAYKTLKECIVKAASLTHYDPSKQLVLATDSSPYGTGAILSQIEEGIEKPIAFASKTLTATQRRYSQIDREGLGVIFGVTKFHKYLYGRKFILQLDNKPLSAIFSPKKPIAVMAAQRLTRWSLKLRAYDFETRFRPTAEHANVDALSRLPAGTDDQFDWEEAKEEEEMVHLIERQTFESPISVSAVARETSKDEILTEVKKIIQSGKWPKKICKEDEWLRPYFNVRNKLMVWEGAILLTDESRIRLLVPQSLKQEILQVLHTGHFGVARMKQTLRQYVWWPGSGVDAEKFCKLCLNCREHASDPPKQHLSWPETEEVWSRLHIDYAGPFLGYMWLIVIDSKSRFPYIGMTEIGKSTARDTIAMLKHIFAIEGLCTSIVSDNGSQFVSSEFQDFLSSNGIQHVTTPIYSPSSNGIAERFVATLKQHMLKSIGNEWDGKGTSPQKSDLWNAARQILFMYRTMPHPELEGRCPAELLHGRKPRNLLSLLIPSDLGKKKEPEPIGRTRFPVGTPVFFRNYGKGPKWLPGRVSEARGRNIRLIETDGRVLKRHCNQLQTRFSPTSSEPGSLPRDAEERPRSPSRGVAEERPRSATPPDRQRLPEIDARKRYPNRNRVPTVRFGYDD